MPQLRRSKMLIASERQLATAVQRQSITTLVKELFPVWKANRERMLVLDRIARVELSEEQMPTMPDDASDEFKRIRSTSPSAFGRLLVSSLCQNTIADGIRLSDSKEDTKAWDVWQRNGMDAKQIPLVESAATFGQSYNLVLPAVGRLDGAKTASIRGKSAIRALAFYDDDSDEYPLYFLEGEALPGDAGMNRWQLTFTDGGAQHWLRCDWDGSNMEYDTWRPHGMDLCPVVRFVNTIDLDGRVMGEIAPVMNTLARIDQTTQDRLVVQRFAAWAVRTVAGMKKPATNEERAAARIALGIGDLLVSENPDTKFGSLPATPLNGHIAAHDSDLRDLAATSQMPLHHLTGLADNMGADGMAAAEAAHMRKADIRKLSWGKSHEDSLRLAGHAMGDPEIANDFKARMHWKQTRTEALQSLSQAISTLVSSGIPIEMLAGRIPDWDQSDTEELRAALEKKRAEEEADAEMAAQRQIEVSTATAAARGNGSAAQG